MTKRTQGRPPRDSGMSGREKLIEATRSYLQTNRKLSLTRSEIAHGCGVTPALISYYFKDKRSLLEAAIKPLLHTYAAKLRAIVDADTPPDSRMRSVILLLLELNADDAFLTDYMLSGFASAKLDAEDRAIFEAVRQAVSGLAATLIDDGRWRASSLLLTEVALWGLCRAFGESVRVQSAGQHALSVRDGLLQDRTDFICSLFETVPALDARAPLSATA